MKEQILLTNCGTPDSATPMTRCWRPEERIPEVKIPTGNVCESCVMGKQHRVSFDLSTEKSRGVLDLVHSDVWGPSPTPSRGGASYFLRRRLLEEGMDLPLAEQRPSVRQISFKEWKALSIVERWEESEHFALGQWGRVHKSGVRGLLHQGGSPTTVHGSQHSSTKWSRRATQPHTGGEDPGPQIASRSSKDVLE